MVSSIRALVGLVGCGLALLIALIAMAHGHEVGGDRSVLVFDPGRVTALSWSGDPIRLVRSGQGWRFADAPTTPVVARAVEDVLTSLRSAHWHRHGGDHAVHRTLSFTIGSFQHEVGIGEALAGTDQTWIVVDGYAMLVDGWLAKLLDPSELAFRDRTPLAAAASAPTIAIHGPHELELTGSPRRLHGMLVAPPRIDALTSALANLELVSIEIPVAAPVTTMTTIDVAGVSVRIGGACPSGGVAVVVASAKPACAKEAAVTEVLHAIDALAGPPADIIDRRPAASGFNRIELRDGTIALDKRVTVTIHDVVHDADPDRTADLLRALAEPGEPVALSTGTPAVSLIIPQIGALDVFGDRVQRRGDPLALAISPVARAILVRSALSLVDAERWSEEPTTITAISLDGVTYRRGAVIGEWSRSPAGPIDPALVDALAEAVAKLHAPARTGTAATPHHLVVTFTPPIGVTVTHELALGAPTADGCPATVATESVTAPLALCTAVAALAR